MRSAAVIFIVASFCGCERELLPLDPSLVVNGFEIRGVVSDRFGNPIPGVSVSVDYEFEYVDDGPEPSRTYIVQSPGEAITVSVVNRSNLLVFTDAVGNQAPGAFTYIWDEKYSNDQPVPPGAYTVRYATGAGVRLTYPVVVSGTKVTTTDSLGRYTVPDVALPVDFYPVADYASNGTSYFGNLRVTSEVILGFSVGGLEVFRTVSLSRNRVVFFDARLN